MFCYLEQAFRIGLRKHKMNMNGVSFFQYEIVEKTRSGLQLRMSDCEKMNVYLCSADGFKSFIKLCDDAIKKILKEEVEESISGSQLSRCNQLVAIREAIARATKNLR